MKRYLILILLSIAVRVDSYSQDLRLGFTASEIQQEFKGSGIWSWTYTSQYGGYHILIADNYRWTTYYYFKARTSSCQLSILYPKDTRTLKYFTNLYGNQKDTQLVSKNYWKITGSGGERLYLLLDYSDDGTAYFMYGYLDEKL